MARPWESERLRQTGMAIKAGVSFPEAFAIRGIGADRVGLFDHAGRHEAVADDQHE